MITRRHRRIAGSALLLLLPLLLVVLLLRPAVREPLGRSLATVGVDLFGGDEGDLRLPVKVPSGLVPGHPVYLAAEERGLRPVAYVVGVETDALRLRFAPGEAREGQWRLLALDAPSGLGDSWRMAVPPDVAADLGSRLSTRLKTLLTDAILPELQERLPAFLARVDPRRDARSREVLSAVGRSVVQRLQPYVDSLSDAVARDMEAHFDLLDRLGLLWKMLRGDARGLARKVMPVAKRSVQQWWSLHQDEVLTAAAQAVLAEAPRWTSWLENDVWNAAREELGEPVLEARRKQIEGAAEDALHEVLDAVVTAPGGGFRTRFAAMLRSRLLKKGEPLLLLEAVP